MSNQSKLKLVMSFSLGVSVEVHAEGRQDQARVDEVGLALDLARAKVGHQAEPLHQVDALQRDLLPVPEAERAAGEVGLVEDRVEAGRVGVVDVAVARGPEEREPKPHPVAVVRALRSRPSGR